jgi:hypothetical protein
MTGVAWAEVTSLEHGHGGPGWELGHCLWSPAASTDGANRYDVMRQPDTGDLVFHLVSGVQELRPRERFLFGTSRVATRHRVITDEPPLPGAWAGAGSYFRVDLAGFTELPTKHAMDAIEKGLEETILADLLNRPKYYPYSRYRDGFRGAQGIYLTRLSSGLALAFQEIVQTDDSALTTNSLAEGIAEGERHRRESTFFKRNPSLRALAIEHHGTKCFACGFDFRERYGSIGEGFIEIHHLNPFAERHDSVFGKATLTTLADLIPICANCHRMVHRRRPAYSLDELKSALRHWVEKS